MKWNLRMKAAERGIWKSVELRQMLADAGLTISAGKMSMLWTTTPTTVRLEDLDVICAVLECTAAELLIPEPAKVEARRQHARDAQAVGDTLGEAGGGIGRDADVKDGGQTSRQTGEGQRPAKVTPRLGRNRTLPPA